MTDLPKKLKQDAIVEALCQIRFSCDEARLLPELIIGKLSQFSDWKTFTPTRLPAEQIPMQIRQNDPDLRFQPILQLSKPDGMETVKFGSNVVSIHLLTSYPGWEVFQEKVAKVIDFIFETFTELKIERVGLRYVNVFTKEKHFVDNLADLNYSITLDAQKLDCSQHLTYRKKYGDKHLVSVQIASPEFVAAPPQEKFSAIVDVDVFTPDNISFNNGKDAKEWVELAHGFEKTEFFKFFTEDMMEIVAE